MVKKSSVEVVQKKKNAVGNRVVRTPTNVLRSPPWDRPAWSPEPTGWDRVGPISPGRSRLHPFSKLLRNGTP
ncbi:hypothetical protein HMPREF9440_00954 [Sutterella parvirubra YIT 11816]|uniref:Uncharacterized protein n=1 Tax=Sutterella parvirubra YIT 11816 TaxID=762967 RepID=H3KDZ4_9BURK|nr:hypothetical protein HMPREF9440_00954 [Sutterella parvirubra YIT 11816]